MDNEKKIEYEKPEIKDVADLYAEGITFCEAGSGGPCGAL